jgi:hypothetical protein
MVDGNLVAAKGTDVYGRLAASKESGAFAGRSELRLELTGIAVNGQAALDSRNHPGRQQTGLRSKPPVNPGGRDKRRITMASHAQTPARRKAFTRSAWTALASHYNGGGPNQFLGSC